MILVIIGILIVVAAFVSFVARGQESFEDKIKAVIDNGIIEIEDNTIGVTYQIPELEEDAKALVAELLTIINDECQCNTVLNSQDDGENAILLYYSAETIDEIHPFTSEDLFYLADGGYVSERYQ
jgi:hypothetical protein